MKEAAAVLLDTDAWTTLAVCEAFRVYKNNCIIWDDSKRRTKGYKMYNDKRTGLCVAEFPSRVFQRKYYRWTVADPIWSYDWLAEPICDFDYWNQGVPELKPTLANIERANFPVEYLVLAYLIGAIFLIPLALVEFGLCYR